MDSLTQIQQYLSSLCLLMVNNIASIHSSPPLTVNEATNADNPMLQSTVGDMEREAEKLFSLFAHTDAFISALPSPLASKSEQEQLIASLQSQLDEEEKEWNHWKKNGELWSKRIANAVQTTAIDHLTATVQQITSVQPIDNQSTNAPSNNETEESKEDAMQIDNR